MDINQQQTPIVQPPTPVEWTWIVQRHETDGKASSIWKLGFISPDGAEVRVTFHQVGDVAKEQAEKEQQKQDAAAQQMQMGMPPMSDPTAFAPEGQPNTDKTEDATFYVTFFSNRNPEFFMKWDTSLSHEDSLVVWITITHGIVDFVRKAKPANVILDDLANGKLKMVLRSVAMDVAAANPEYELEQTQKHPYRSFFQIKKTGMQSAFANSVQGKSNEGDTPAPKQASPVTGGQAQVQAQTQQSNVDANERDKSEDPTIPQPEPESKEDKPAFASTQPIPIKQTAPRKKGLTIEIGRDYSIAVKDKDHNVIDRYRAKSPADILRWINEKGYGANRMVIVDEEQPSGDKEIVRAPERQEKKAEDQGKNVDEEIIFDTVGVERIVIDGKSIKIHSDIPATQAAMMNYIVNASMVRLTEEGVEFTFETDRDMNFKKAIVELACKKIGVKLEETEDSSVSCASCGKMVRKDAAMKSPTGELYHQQCDLPSKGATDEHEPDMVADCHAPTSSTNIKVNEATTQVL